MELPFKETIYLEQMDQVSLMNRMDTKYKVRLYQLKQLLELVKEDYYLMTINEKGLLGYSTTYYDTPEDTMYMVHHNGHLNRYKIRQRTYLESGISFLEIKHKNNKGRTQKKRLKKEFTGNLFSPDEMEFINSYSPYSVNLLSPKIENGFTRITLVSKAMDERCTIDLNLNYKNGNQSLALEKLAIIEIKSNGIPRKSPLAIQLKKMHVNKTGFSKYCIGRTLMNSDLKNNAFKPKLRQLNKLLSN